jgi:hypothetical protein
MDFLAHCLEPQISEQGIFDQLPVMGDCCFIDRVYYTIAVFFDFNDRTCILIVGKFLRDGDGRGISKAQANNVIQCLEGDIAGCPVADETGGALGQVDGCVVGVLTCLSSGSTVGRE